MQQNFPANFTWGAAAASYQIEGAATADGKGPSVWDMYARRPGMVWRGQTGERACEHYRLWREDIALMKELGLKAYRLSLSWPRILPSGRKPSNAPGIAFYDRLVDGLLEAGIEPWVTLFHWDYPYELYLQGGWLNPDSPDWFADYASLCADALSDRVRHWFTLNEPQCFIGLGLQSGEQAPGDKLGMREVLRAGHNALLGHGKAVRALRSRDRSGKALVGWAPVVATFMPAGDSAADAAAAIAAMGDVKPGSVWGNSWWLDPVLLGRYPEAGIRAYGADAPEPGPDDMATIAAPLDFCGANIYQGDYVRAAASGYEVLPWTDNDRFTAFKWRVTPESLYWGPRWLWERYGIPVVISENGMSGNDWVSLDGAVHDPARVDFMARYLRELRRASSEGIGVAGYFAWSLMDNFEWSFGYRERFGLVHVDFETQKRTPKDSALWYAELIRSGGATLG
jgi:beta-glucosidase